MCGESRLLGVLLGCVYLVRVSTKAREARKVLEQGSDGWTMTLEGLAGSQAGLMEAGVGRTGKMCGGPC